jgi:hypothetical protein
LNALDDPLKSIFDIVHPRIILIDDALALEPELLAHIRLFVDFILLPLKPIFKLLNLLVQVELVQLVLEYPTVSTFPLVTAHLLILVETGMDFDLQVLPVLPHLHALNLILMNKRNS